MNFQTGTFTHSFADNVLITFQYVLVLFSNETGSTGVDLFNNTYTVYANRPAGFFSLTLDGWPFASEENHLTASTLVSINLSGLDIGTQETASNFVLAMPYAGGYLFARFPKTVLLDDTRVKIRPDVHVTSISRPVGATFSISIPSFKKSVTYAGEMVTQDHVLPPKNTLQIVLIVAGTLAGVVILLVGVGVLLNRMQKEEELTTPIEEDDEERKRLRLIQQMQYASFEKSIGRGKTRSVF